MANKEGNKIIQACRRENYRPKTKLSIAMGKYPSILQAEVFIITLCAEVILKRMTIDQHIIICSDSQAALMAIS